MEIAQNGEHDALLAPPEGVVVLQDRDPEQLVYQRLFEGPDVHGARLGLLELLSQDNFLLKIFFCSWKTKNWVGRTRSTLTSRDLKMLENSFSCAGMLIVTLESLEKHRKSPGLVEASVDPSIERLSFIVSRGLDWLGYLSGG